MGRLVIFLLFSCSLFKTEIKQNPLPPDLKPIIEKVERSGESDIKKELKQETLTALKSCQQYADEADKRFKKLEDELSSLKVELNKKDEKIKELEEELSTWRTIKFYSWLAVIGFVVFSFLRAIWANRVILMRLAGIPLP